MYADQILAHLSVYWKTATGVAVSMFVLTVIGAALNRERKDEIALWLMGDQSEENWSKSFALLFDSVFGRSHFSVQCFFRSAVASSLTVFGIWLIMGSAGVNGLRLQTELSLGTLIFLGLLINVVADYVSLLETRWLLDRMPRKALTQVAVLVIDLLISAAIIWIAIYFIQTLLHGPFERFAPEVMAGGGDIETLAEVLGLFSIYSVFFYSTFLTSVWIWAYLISTWIMRALARLNLRYWFEVEKFPILVLTNVLAVVAFVGTLVISPLFARDGFGITQFDRILCSLFKGEVCMDVANLTVDKRAQLQFIILACEGGVIDECSLRGWLDSIKADGDKLSMDGELAVLLFRPGCAAGDIQSCIGLGVLYEDGNGVVRNQTEAANIYKRACDLGYVSGCSGQNRLAAKGVGSFADSSNAISLLENYCSDGILDACTNLGAMYDNGFAVPKDYNKANNFFRQSCNSGHAPACSRLAENYELGQGVPKNPSIAAQLDKKACELGLEFLCE